MLALGRWSRRIKSPRPAWGTYNPAQKKLKKKIEWCGLEKGREGERERVVRSFLVVWHWTPRTEVLASVYPSENAARSQGHSVGNMKQAM